MCPSRLTLLFCFCELARDPHTSYCCRLWSYATCSTKLANDPLSGLTYKRKDPDCICQSIRYIEGEEKERSIRYIPGEEKERSIRYIPGEEKERSIRYIPGEEKERSIRYFEGEEKERSIRYFEGEECVDDLRKGNKTGREVRAVEKLTDEGLHGRLDEQASKRRARNLPSGVPCGKSYYIQYAENERRESWMAG